MQWFLLNSHLTNRVRTFVNRKLTTAHAETRLMSNSRWCNDFFQWVAGSVSIKMLLHDSIQRCWLPVKSWRISRVLEIGSIDWCGASTGSSDCKGCFVSESLYVLDKIQITPNHSIPVKEGNTLCSSSFFFVVPNLTSTELKHNSLYRRRRKMINILLHLLSCVRELNNASMIHKVPGNFGMLHHQKSLFEAKSEWKIWPSTMTKGFEFGFALRS